MSTAWPGTIPVFPLTGALLFPRSMLPLHIFEPRYRAMVRDAREGDGVIGMIQPRSKDEVPELYAVGGLGTITRCEEINDGRFLITLEGQQRFRVTSEIEGPQPYRRVAVRYDEFAGDLAEPDPLAPAIRAALHAGLEEFINVQNMAADWSEVEASDDETLVNALARACPFAPVEQQALLEAADVEARARLLMELMRFSTGAGRRPTLQ